jgi:uncharacterized protein YcbX
MRAVDRAAVAQPAFSPVVVTALATTPVKGLRILARSEVMLDFTGVEDNRCFYLINAQGGTVNGKRIGTLSAVCANFDADAERLTMVFPDGRDSVTPE